ncbi:conserved hypothetical protein [Paecilomyces variotii No. 5]|uniref:Xylanolytic transcriptional activator regulatory domain-containing protein n=1 Tax=Byssochlamys spectabilis (strain No. 5 / NBRC 109023) TaxID=1356009 RepID=V5G7Y7_BYSSN|nr:conserved hypothetical protein [Paecilomyces variotii No. 5]
MDKPLSTADIPRQFLQTVFLLGHIPLKALASEPRVSYAMYIPPDHYDTESPRLPLLVSVHGTGRNLSGLYGEELVSFANSTPCAILAPLFPAGLDGPNDLDSYKNLISLTLRSDLELFSILEEVAQRWPGIQTDKIFLMGFSGGGQFAHRFLYLYPERLAAVSVGAPGKVTKLDETQKWPAGTADVDTLFSRPVNKERIRQVPIQLIVGSADDSVHGGTEFWDWVQQFRKRGNDGSSEHMAQGRIQALNELHSLWKEDGIESSLQVVDGVAHDYDVMQAIAFHHHVLVARSSTLHVNLMPSLEDKGSLQTIMEENERLRDLVHASGREPPEIAANRTLPTSSSAADQVASCPTDSTGPMAAEQQLEELNLDIAVIQELFTYFSRHYERHLPIIDLGKPVEAILTDSPLLFWTVVIISIRKHPLHCAHFQYLKAPFKRLLSDYLVASIRSVYTIQALLLLCLWPFPVEKQTDDPSWEYCAVAVAAVFKMGLDDSQTSWIDASEPPSDNLACRLKTWLGCFIVSTTLSADRALPPPMGSVSTMVTGICERLRGDISEETLFQIDIAGYSARAAAVLNTHSSCSLQNSLTSLLEHELDVLETRMPQCVSVPSQVDLLAARTRLYALPLLSQTSRKPETQHPDPLEKAIWYKGLHVAIRLANIFADSAQPGTSRSNGELPDRVTPYYPKHYFRVLVMAGMYFINFLAIDRDIPTHERTLARVHIEKVKKTLLHWSHHEMDEEARVARMIELLSRHVEVQDPSQQLDEEPQAKPPTSVITNGMKMAGKFRRTWHPSYREQRSDTSSASTGAMAEPPSDVDPTAWIGYDMSEWNSWFTNVDNIINMFQSPMPTLQMGDI